MKANELLRNTDSRLSTSRTVYAIKKEKRIYGEKVYYLLASESGHLMWEDASRYNVTDSEMPSDWICIQHEKNRTINPADRLSGDGSVTFSCYIGPSILMNPIDNLVKVSNVDAALSQAIMDAY